MLRHTDAYIHNHIYLHKQSHTRIYTHLYTQSQSHTLILAHFAHTPQVIPVHASEKAAECQHHIERVLYATAKKLSDEQVRVTAQLVFGGARAA